MFNFDLSKKTCRKQSKLGNCLFCRFACNSCWCTGKFQQVINYGNYHLSNSKDKFLFRGTTKACKVSIPKHRIQKTFKLLAETIFLKLTFFLPGKKNKITSLAPEYLFQCISVYLEENLAIYKYLYFLLFFWFII